MSKAVFYEKLQGYRRLQTRRFRVPSLHEKKKKKNGKSWTLHRQVTNSRPNVHHLLAVCQFTHLIETVGQLSDVCRPTVGHLMANCWPTVERQTANREAVLHNYRKK